MWQNDQHGKPHKDHEYFNGIIKNKTHINNRLHAVASGTTDVRKLNSFEMKFQSNNPIKNDFNVYFHTFTITSLKTSNNKNIEFNLDDNCLHNNFLCDLHYIHTSK